MFKEQWQINIVCEFFAEQNLLRKNSKEKILAAKRAGIKEIILCEQNKKDINEIQPEYLKGLTFHYVNNISEVLDIALTEKKVNRPLVLNYKTQTTQAQTPLQQDFQLLVVRKIERLCQNANFDISLLRFVRIDKIQGVEIQGERSVLMYMTEP